MTRNTVSKSPFRTETLILFFIIITAFFAHSPYYSILLLALAAAWIICKLLSKIFKKALRFRLKLPKFSLRKKTTKPKQQIIDYASGNVEERYAKALIYQLAYRIRDEIRKKYPEAFVSVISNRPDLLMLRCEPVKVKLQNAGEFSHGEITFAPTGEIIEFKLLVAKALSDVKILKDSEKKSADVELSVETKEIEKAVQDDPVDIPQWYQGEDGNKLYDYVFACFEQGHKECYIGPDGMVLVKEDGKLKKTENIVPNFPVEGYWQELTSLFVPDGFTGEKSGKRLRVSPIIERS